MHDAPGTTRDAVDEELIWRGRRYVLTDTAGLRKKRQVVDKVEVFSAQRALRAVERADVVVQNFRPGVMARHGLDWETARSINSQLVYVSASGYGEDF